MSHDQPGSYAAWLSVMAIAWPVSVAVGLKLGVQALITYRSCLNAASAESITASEPFSDVQATQVLPQNQVGRARVRGSPRYCAQMSQRQRDQVLQKVHSVRELLQAGIVLMLSLADCRLHTAERGGASPGKPLLLLLHGFPEMWYSWRHQLQAFASTHHVVAMDLRGYVRSSCPKVCVRTCPVPGPLSAALTLGR